MSASPRRKRLLAVSGIGGIALLLAGCSNGSSAQSSAGSGGGTHSATTAQTAGPIKDGGQIIVGLPAAPAALDPTTESTYYGRIVFANMCLGLYGVDQQSQPAPVLASGPPQVSAGGTVLTIPIRTGVKFNDGTPLDAAAVVTSLQRDITLPTSARASSLKDVASVSATGPDTVQIKLKQPDSAMPTILAGRSGIVMSPTALSKEGSHFSQNPVCVGPFSFVSRPSLDQITLKKSPYFYDASKVHAAGLQFTVISDPSTCYSNLQSGAINVAACLAPNDAALLTHNPSYSVQTVVTNAYGGIDINVDNGNGYNKAPAPASDPLAQSATLRKAFELSIDRNALNKVVFDGINKPGCTPLAPSSPYYTPIPCPTRDIAKAKALVKAAGVPTPIHLTLMVPTGTLNTQEGELIASETAPAGFDVSVQSTEFTTALSEAQNGKYQMFEVGWSGRVDPDQNITPFYTPGSPLNYAGVQDPALLSLLAKARTEQSTSARKATYAQVEQKLESDLGIIYLYNEAFQLATVSKLSGVSFTPDGIIHLASAGFTG